MARRPVLETLFPKEPRDFAGRRALKIGLRAAHVLCAGVLVGAYAFDAPHDLRIGWLVAALVSGCLILLLDLIESGVVLLQVRGVVVVVKLGLLCTLPWLGAWVLGFLVLLSVLSSHAPGKIRHHTFVRGFKGSETRG